MKKSELRFGDVVELRNGNFRRIGENGRIETLKGKYYKGMELNEIYSLEELGIEV